eukprot:Hpha_TRINITY_DN12671_c0_g1::TRINITY_DN12671_c0_g1_i1::g.49923::m.49923
MGCGSSITEGRRRFTGLTEEIGSPCFTPHIPRASRLESLEQNPFFPPKAPALPPSPVTSGGRGAHNLNCIDRTYTGTSGTDFDSEKTRVTEVDSERTLTFASAEEIRRRRSGEKEQRGWSQKKEEVQSEYTEYTESEVEGLNYTISDALRDFEQRKHTGTRSSESAQSLYTPGSPHDRYSESVRPVLDLAEMGIGCYTSSR